MKTLLSAALAGAAGLAGVLFPRARGARRAGRRRFRRFYREAALILLNTVVLLLAVNALLFVPLAIKDALGARQSAPRHHPVAPDRWAALEKVYPGFGRDEIQLLLDETYSPARSFVYEPYTEFRERPYAGRYVNVDVNGFRLTERQGPWPPDAGRYFNVFLFGGSTTFGFGVPDGETVASHLQRLLSESGLPKEARVYNFGRGSYYSTQERILFERLLAAGLRPDLAVFIDGLNDAHHYDDRPSSAERMEGALEGRPTAGPSLFARVPMVRVASAALGRLGLGPQGASAPEWAETPRDREACGDVAVLRGVVERYAENKRMAGALAAAYGVKTLFVWQPVAAYKYDLRGDPLAGGEHPRRACVEGAYARMSRLAAEQTPGDDFLWAADMQEGAAGPLYVDALHYSGRMSGLLARVVAGALREKSLLPAAGR